MAGAVAEIGTPLLCGTRYATAADLVAVNSVVTRAVATWQVSDRVIRLAMPSLRYTPADFQHMRILMGTDCADAPIAVAVWEVSTGRSNAASAIEWLLHGLYVMPERQRSGVGASLLQHVIDMATQCGVATVALHAWRDAEAFFHARGFQPERATPLYPRYMRKVLGA